MTETVELLQQLIRNRCVNDGTRSSGEEHRNAADLESYLGTAGLDVERFDAAPGRTSLVARIEGSDPGAPSLCLMGHTDVVPVEESAWSRDPFGGELVDGEVWGRGAIDMLNLTASMAVAFRQLAKGGFRPRGDLIYFAVADEESGSTYGAQWMADHHPDAIRADYVLTENGGIHTSRGERPVIGMNVAEKGVAWRRLRVHGTPGHGSRPWRSDNALVRAAAVVQRLHEYRPKPRFHELWRQQVDLLPIGEAQKEALLDEDRIDDVLTALPDASAASYLHACTHTTFSPNAVSGTMKTNVIPAAVEIDVDVRTLPGETADDVSEHLRVALGDLADAVEITPLMNDPATASPIDTPLWDALQRAVAKPFPGAEIRPQLLIGFTDSRVYRQMGAVAYGAGLFSPDLNSSEYGARFHGNDERVDVDSLALTTQLWVDVARDLLS